MTLPVTCAHEEWHCQLHVLTRNDTVSYMYSRGMTLSVTYHLKKLHSVTYHNASYISSQGMTLPVTCTHKEWNCQLHIIARNDTTSNISLQGMTLPVTYHKEWHCQLHVHTKFVIVYRFPKYTINGNTIFLLGMTMLVISIHLSNVL